MLMFVNKFTGETMGTLEFLGFMHKETAREFKELNLGIDWKDLTEEEKGGFYSSHSHYLITVKGWKLREVV